MLQTLCWNKFQRNPQVNTAIRGRMGRMTGMGFGVFSEIPEIQKHIDQTEYDWRNRLYSFWPKYVARSDIEGELYLLLTAHSDGFIEVDFIDPLIVSGGGDDDTGIIFHPTKQTLPLFYNIKGSTGSVEHQIPSIYIARDPSLVETVRSHNDFKVGLQQMARTRAKKYKPLGGYKKFIVSWDKGFVTRRAISHLRTTIEWLNHYENLKKYEIDHKKSAGSYVWVFTIDDPRAFKTWLSLTDEQRAKTGIMSKKTPGGTLVLPPGMSIEVKSPSLPQIKEQDTDILHMITAGLNEPEDISTGKTGSSYASVKATRGPFSDRTSDELAYFQRFLQYDFYGSVFFLKNVLGVMASSYVVNVAVGWDDKREPVMRNVKRPPEHLIDVNFPTSEMIDLESRAKALLGVKHGPLSESLGISNKEVARKLGIGDYARQRLEKATESKKYPDLVYEGGVDAESLQEQKEGEEPKSKNTGGSDK